MKLLLDTHALVWYVEGDAKLSATARTLIKAGANDVFISPATYWEIAIKVSLGKWVLNRPYADFIDLCLNAYGFQILPVMPSHTTVLVALPFPPQHKDPFDRLLVAQAITEQMAVVSADVKLDAYPITRHW